MKKSKKNTMSETSYLLSTVANRKRLQESIAQLKNRSIVIIPNVPVVPFVPKRILVPQKKFKAGQMGTNGKVWTNATGRDNGTTEDEKKMNCKEANDISITEFLYSLGFLPTRISGNSYWYLSPIREEKTSSFKVDTKLNRWYDHGLSKGGKLVDLGVQLFNISVSELLIRLSREDFKPNSFSFQQPKLIDPPSFEIKKVKELTNLTVIRYLEQRSIPKSIAAKYCWEVYYRLNEKNYFAIAIQNDSYGFEIRNRYFKACLGAKDITTIRSEGAKRVVLFEGLIDFLSALKGLLFNPSESSVIILNSVNQIEKVKLKIKELSASHIEAFFDNDVAGVDCFTRLKKKFPNAVDQSALYREYKDLNEMISKKNSSNARL